MLLTRHCEFKSDSIPTSDFYEHWIIHGLLIYPTIHGNLSSKSAGDNSSVLFVFESCVLLHVRVCFSAGDDQRTEGDDRNTKERNDECEGNSSL